MVWGVIIKCKSNGVTNEEVFLNTSALIKLNSETKRWMVNTKMQFNGVIMQLTDAILQVQQENPAKGLVVESSWKAWC